MKIRKLVGLLAIVTLGLVSCSKEKKSLPESNIVVPDMLSFNSIDEFNKIRATVIQMSETERIQWEQQNGFKSFGTRCMELFFEFEKNGISSDQDIYDFVDNNKDCFYIREEEGELYLTSYLETSIYYYFVNEDKIMKVGDELIKVFDEGCIFASSDALDLLLSIEQFDLCNKVKGLEYVCNEIVCVKYDGGYIFRETNGSNRTLVEMYIELPLYAVGAVPEYLPTFMIRPYHKTLGIWYYCNRTLSWNVVANWAWNTPSGARSDNGNSSGSYYGSVYRTSLGSIYVSTQSSVQNVRYTSFVGWGDTPDTDPVNFSK